MVLNSVHFDWASQMQDAVLEFTVFMCLISLSGLMAALLWMLDKTGLLDQCCFILVIYCSEIK